MLLDLDDLSPDVDPSAWVAPTATVVGDVRLGPEASVWYSAVVRADRERIEVGAGSNLQDGVVLHADPGFPCLVGAGVVVGHRAVLHGCRIGDDVLVGMGAIVLNGAVVGAGSLIGAGALVPEGMEVPPRSLVLGAPAKVRRPTTEEEVERFRTSAGTYRDLRRRHAVARDTPAG